MVVQLCGFSLVIYILLQYTINILSYIFLSYSQFWGGQLFFILTSTMLFTPPLVRLVINSGLLVSRLDGSKALHSVPSLPNQIVQNSSPVTITELQDIYNNMQLERPKNINIIVPHNYFLYYIYLGLNSKFVEWDFFSSNSSFSPVKLRPSKNVNVLASHALSCPINL